MLEKRESYRHILKATSLFGGVQVFIIIVNLLRSKFIAVFLGPTGLGIASLYLASINMVVSIASMGLNYSAVREISQAADTKDLAKMGRKISVFQNWMWVCSSVGAVSTILFAPFLSELAFGNKEYTWAFIWLSCTVFFNVLISSNVAILQGMQRFKASAKASVIGSLLGLLTSLPLYYFFGLEGIVPALVIAAIASYLIGLFFLKGIPKDEAGLTFSSTFKEGIEMAKLGLIMMLSVFIGTLVIYLINAYISQFGSIADVGYYQAGIGLTNQYIGLIFSAMSVDYFPRLSAVSKDNRKVREMVNQQAEIVILVVAPLLVALISSAPLIITILLSPDFYVITDLVRWIALGMIFKASSYAIGYISFAKGDKKVFFFVEGLGSNILTFTLSLLGYKLLGLEGLGIAFFASYLIYFVIIFFVSRHRYEFTLDLTFIRIFLIHLVLCCLAFAISYFIHSFVAYILNFLLFLCATLLSLKKLDEKIDIKKILLNYKNT